MATVSDDVKAQVMAALLHGQAVSKVAKDYKIGKATVSRYKKLLPAETLEQVGTKKRDQLAESVGRYMDDAFNAIHATLKVTQNAEWLNRQSAAELATFIGVTSDKIFRVLEALETAQAQSEDIPGVH